MKQIVKLLLIADQELSGGGQHSFVDDWPLIWKNFSSNGYMTLLSEEQPGIFSYKAKVSENGDKKTKIKTSNCCTQ